MAAAARSHVVVDGDTVEGIADAFGVEVYQVLDEQGRVLALHGWPFRPLRVGETVTATDLELDELALRGALVWDDPEPEEGRPEHEEFVLPAPHPGFERWFPSPRYSDLADEFAPFGSDEGFDVVVELCRTEPVPGIAEGSAPTSRRRGRSIPS